jgi:hypothetical protein
VPVWADEAGMRTKDRNSKTQTFARKWVNRIECSF